MVPGARPSCSSLLRRRRSSRSLSRLTFIRRWSTSSCHDSADSSGWSRSSSPAEMRLVPARILDIHVKPPTRSMNRFDIEVEGSHNYFVDGVMVHNSPETTSGGRALKFYASVRLDVRRIETLKDGTEAVGSRTRIKVVKNKCEPAVQSRGVRHYFRDRDQPGGRPDRPGSRAVDRPQVGGLVHLRGRPARPGQGELPQLPAGQPGPRQRDREEDQGEARCRAAYRRGSCPGPQRQRIGKRSSGGGPGSQRFGSWRSGGPGRSGPCGRRPGRRDVCWRRRRCLTGRPG